MKNLIAVIAVFFICSPVFAQGEIKINQIGFHPESQKIAVVPGETEAELKIIDTTGNKVVHTTGNGEVKSWPFSEETVTKFDFSDFRDPGTYHLVNDNAGSSYSFEIRNDIYREISKASIKAYYFNRATTALEEEYAGKWARPMGHPDDKVIIHASAATDERPEGTVISSSKGWYDAGDYNKYAVNSGISTYTILAAYEHFPEYYHELELNIPESGNGVPDILDEARWNLDWLLTVRDPNDGGVYHKVTSLDFAGIVMPHEDNADRYAVMKSTGGTLNFAAVMAVAARVYQPYDPEFARRCLAAAKDAWQWALQNPNEYYVQPDDVNTGAYRDQNLEDEFDWAAAELFITTGNADYWKSRNFHEMNVGVPSWRYVRPLAWISLAHHHRDLPEAADPELIKTRIVEQADELMEEYKTSAYGVSMGRFGNQDFVWGSNGVIGNHSLMLIQAFRLTGDESYLNAAIANLDYILGRNATGYSFVTGYGTKSPMYPHHRQSAANDNIKPVPGFVVGGPQPGQQDDCNYPSELPAKTYLDHWCSYSTNEVAINWNAPLVYLTGAADHFYKRDQIEKRRLIGLLNKFLDGASHNDPEIHDRFWAEDLIYTSSSGERFGKNEIMQSLKDISDVTNNRQEPSTIFRAEDIDIRLYGNTAIVAFRLVAETWSNDNSLETNYYLNTGTFFRQNGIWKAITWQATIEQ